LVALFLPLTSPNSALATQAVRPENSARIETQGTALEEAFAGSSLVDMRTSRAKPVVTLRDRYGIPPPSETVRVKVFDRDKLPASIQPAFANKNVRGVTIGGRYIAILRTDFAEEYHDILDHELVHAYIWLAAPKELPFWFHEASAVFFSTNKTVSFYGKSTDTPGEMRGKTTELTDVYKQKLQNFRFLTEYVGEDKFRKWYANAVMTGDVSARPLLGLSEKLPDEDVKPRPFPVAGAGLAVGVVVLAGSVAMLLSRRKKKLVIDIE